MPVFSETLKKERTQRKMTQSAMAEMLGTKRSTYSLYESGKREPDLDTLQKFANILHITLDELIGYVPSEPSFPTGVKVHSVQEYYKLKEIFNGYAPTSTDKEIIGELVDMGETSQKTIAYFDSHEYTQEELEELKKYAEFLKSKRDTK